MNEEQREHLIQQIKDENENTEFCNDLMTKALEALEKYEYTMAIVYGRYCLNKTEWIEQRMAVISLLITANSKSKDATDYFLKTIYKS